MSDIIKIKYTGTHWYIMIKYMERFYRQAEYLDISPWEYKGKLIDEFRGMQMSTEIYFSSFEDAIAAKEWIETLLIMKELVK